MKQVILTIDKNEQVGKDIYLMRLKGDLSDIKNYGEFINIAIPNFYLRRPISVSDYTTEYVDILYKVLGNGTDALAKIKKGDQLDTLVGLGNGFDMLRAKKPLLIAGGIGIAPLIGLAKEYSRKKITPTLVYGARSKDDIVLVEELKKYCNVIVTTDDGSYGYCGNVVECLKMHNIDFDYYYACGPLRMLDALVKLNDNGSVSLEARMGCGFGACMGCTIKTINGPKRVCKEGPVFDASEVLFNE